MSAIDLTNDQSVAQVVSQLTEWVSEVSKQGAVLTPAQRHTLLKMRPNGVTAVSAILNLAQRYQLVLPSYTLAQMQTDFALMQRITPLVEVGAAMGKAASDDLLSTTSKVWGATLTLYAMLQNMAYREPAIATELALLKGYFAKKATSSTNGGAQSTNGNGSASAGNSGSNSAPTSGTATTGSGTPVTVIANPVVGGSLPPGATKVAPEHGANVTVMRQKARQGDRRRTARPHAIERRHRA